MSLASNPCTECRKQHRKCSPLQNVGVCQRCAQLDLLCIPSSMGFVDDQEVVIDGSKEMKQMRKMVNLLEQTMQQWELELDQYRSMYHNNTSPTPPPTDSVSSFAINKTLLEPRYRLDSLVSNHDQLQQKYLFTKGKEWQITLVNGHWRIDTDITKLSDLDKLTRQHPFFLYRSPSPFQGISADTPIIIQFSEDWTLTSFSVKLARNNLLSSSKMLVDTNHLFPPPSLLIQHPTWVIDRLVAIYFEHYNSSMALLYKPTFMAHYQSLVNPLSCPVTMAICCMVCCGHDDHIYAKTTRQDDDDFVDEDWFSCRVKRRAMGGILLSTLPKHSGPYI
ncbi:hypothetical protein BC941DRAFT_468601 [Chlamydoabsidia padenii]|nr:hypothetical protein BC941DRAFT_468601 [Chlamydoabsidia padenii]